MPFPGGDLNGLTVKNSALSAWSGQVEVEGIECQVGVCVIESRSPFF